MAKHVKYKYQVEERDFSVHVANGFEYSLCNRAFDGMAVGVVQDFVVTSEKVTCKECIGIINICRNMNVSDF